MILNIQDIINKKLEQMAADEVIEKQIEKSVEKTVMNAVTDVFESYDLKKSIRNMLESEVSDVVNKIGFTAYNQFIVDTMNDLINGVLKEDIKKKITGAFDCIFMKKIDVINISDIAKNYRQLLIEDHSIDPWELDNEFHVSFDYSDSHDAFKYVNITFAEKKPTSSYGYDEHQLEMRLMAYKDDNFSISSVKYEGQDLSKLNELRFISDFEAFIASLYFNKTQIIMDVSEYEVDTSLED